jgi:hypothetical protein
VDSANFPAVFDTLFDDSVVVTGVKIEVADTDEAGAPVLDSEGKPVMKETEVALDFGAWLATFGIRDAFAPADVDPKESLPQ